MPFDRRSTRNIWQSVPPVIGERDIHFHGGQLVKEAKMGRLLFYPDGGMNVVYVGDVITGHILAAQKGKSS